MVFPSVSHILLGRNGANKLPRGVPHSLQGLAGGVEFLLVFDDGSFSEDNTFLASEAFAHNPVSNSLNSAL